MAKQLLLGKKITWEVDEEMMAHVDGYVKFVRTQVGTITGAKLHVEQRVPLFYDGSQQGTSDVIILGDSAAMAIDLKYGEGVSVEAVKNSQLTIYLQSWLKHKKVNLHASDRVHRVIYQPRARDGRFVRRWETTVRELNEFSGEIHDTAMDIILDPDNQPFYAEPEKVCRWCPAKSICSAYAELLFQDAPAEVSLVKTQTPGFPRVESLTPTQIGKIIQYAPDLRKWLGGVQDYAEACAKGDEPIPGLKWVAGRGSRSWGAPDEEVFKFLKRVIPREEVYVRSLMSPAQAEKRLKAQGLRRPVSSRFNNRFKELITRTAGDPVLVHVSDDRPALDGSLSEADKSLL